MRSEGASRSPASFGSSTPFGNAIEVIRISCASANGTRLTTNSSLARMLARVSLGSRGPLLPMPIPTVAGSLPNTLKNENGAALMAPLASLVVIHAMGRGNTVAKSNLYRSGGVISLKSNCIFRLHAPIELYVKSLLLGYKPVKRYVLKTPLVYNHGPPDEHVRLREGRRSRLVCRRRQGTSAVADHDRQTHASSRGAAGLTVDQPLDPPAEPDRTRAKLPRSLSSFAGGSRSGRRAR